VTLFYLTDVTQKYHSSLFSPHPRFPQILKTEFRGEAWLQESIFSEKKHIYTGSPYFCFSKWGDVRQDRGAL